jgi:hypothetical protein
MDCCVVVQWPLHRDLIFVTCSEKKLFSVFQYVQYVVPVKKNKCICECMKLSWVFFEVQIHFKSTCDCSLLF